MSESTPLAQGFAEQVMHWSRGQGAAEASVQLAHRAALLLSTATSDGQVCIELADSEAFLALNDEAVSADIDTAIGIDTATNTPLAASTLALTETGAAGVDLPALRNTLLASGVVGTPDERGAMPMIFDEQNRLYLHRYFDYEARLAARLWQAASQAASQADTVLTSDSDAKPENKADTCTEQSAVSETDLRHQLDKLFSRPNDAQELAATEQGNATANRETHTELDWQKLAAALSMLRRLTIISGGPGTGKTTTVVNVLACLLAQDPECRIKLAAPTGKAAARMSEAIRERAVHLPAELAERMPDTAYTIHRLLGVQTRSSGFRHHAGNLLTVDALVIDEASMLDLSLATQLLEAVPAEARIILLGDKDQLSAVESGAVFSELCSDPSLSEACVDSLSRVLGVQPDEIKPPEALRSSQLYDSVVWLTRTYRFASDSGIGQLAKHVNKGDTPAVLDILQQAKHPDIDWIDDGEAELSQTTRQAMLDGYEEWFQSVSKAIDDNSSDENDVAAMYAGFASFRVLCAARKDHRGVYALNEWIEANMRKQLPNELVGEGSERNGPTSLTADMSGKTNSASKWYTGRPVLVQRNDYLLKLFNGDIGITRLDASGVPLVYFPEPDGGFRAIAAVRLPEHETAFAMTVHKSQGSEFDRLMLVLPEQATRVLSRELLYTGITRAKENVVLVGAADVLEEAVCTVTRRRSGLMDRMGEVGGVFA